MILEQAHPGERLHVLSGRAASANLTRRLAEMGLRSGASLSILSRTSGGGAILAIGDDRIAVSRAILGTITVTRDAGEPPVHHG